MDTHHRDRRTVGYRAVPPRSTCPPSSTRCWTSGASTSVFAQSPGAHRAAAEPWMFYEGPPTANGMPGTHHVEARVFKDVFPRFQTMQGYHVAPQGRLGLPRPAGRARRREGARLHRQERHRGVRHRRVQRHAAASRCCATSTRSRAMTDRMGYWVDMRERLPDDGPRVRRVASGGRSSRSTTRACWSRTTASRRTARAAAPACPTTSWPRATRPSSTRRSTCGSRSPRGPLAGHGAALLVWTTTPGRWCPTPRSPCTPSVTYVVATDGERDAGRRRAAGRRRRSARAGRSLETLRRRRDGALDVPAAVRPGRVPGRRAGALRRARRLRHHRGRHRPGAPVPRVRRGRPRGRAARYGLPVVNPVAPDGHFEDDVPLVGGQFFKHADADLVARPRRRAACCSGTSPYEHAYPHCWRCHTALHLLRAAVLVHPHHRSVKDALLRENEKTNWYPDDDQVGPLRRLAATTTSTGRCPAAATGARRCRSGAATRTTRPASARCAELGRAGRHRPVRPRPAPAVRRRRHASPARPCGGDGAPRARGDRRLVRLRLDAVRAVGLPARRGLEGAVRAGLPGPVHLRGDRPDPRLVLHADGGRHAGVRPVVVRERALPRATSWPRTAARCPSTWATSSSRSR